MVNFTILAGGFSTFIATYVFDSDASTLSLVNQNPTGTNPSWIAAHPTNASVLYAVNEASPVGALQSFLVDEAGNLTLVDTISTEGNGPTFTNPLSTGEVTGMNFGSPNCSLMATDPNDPAKFIESPDVVFPVPEGAKSNPHMSLEHNGEVLVPDLGGDKIWRLVNSGKPGNFEVQGQINIDAGAGPRHIAILDDILFTVHEVASTLTAQRIPEGPNGTTLPLISNITTVDATQAAINGTKFAAAEILISTPTDEFPDPLIYVSNRNIGPTIIPDGDTIAIFQFVTSNTTDTEEPAAGDNGEETEDPAADPSADPSADPTADPAEGEGQAETGDSNTDSNADPTADEPAAPETEDPSAGRPVFAGGRPNGAGRFGGRPPFGAPRGSSVARAIYNAKRSTRIAKKRTVRKRAAEGELKLIAQIPTGLQQIRSMALGKVDAGTDQFLIAGANTDGGVAIFRRTDGGRNLELVARNTDLGNRTSFVFL